jgi:hypothetical protein
MIKLSEQLKKEINQSLSNCNRLKMKTGLKKFIFYSTISFLIPIIFQPARRETKYKPDGKFFASKSKLCSHTIPKYTVLNIVCVVETFYSFSIDLQKSINPLKE